MISEATPADDAEAAQIHALAQAAYAMEAQAIGCNDFPPLRESLTELRQSSDSFLVFRNSRRIIGALSFIHQGISVVITRLIVSPKHLREGIATALLTELHRRFSSTGSFVVSTAASNTPAVHLYTRHGYRASTLTTCAEGIQLVQLVKSVSGHRPRTSS